jgi:hypothetical protein
MAITHAPDDENERGRGSRKRNVRAFVRAAVHDCDSQMDEHRRREQAIRGSPSIPHTT